MPEWDGHCQRYRDELAADFELKLAVRARAKELADKRETPVEPGDGPGVRDSATAEMR
ncbi:hypothetical protein [Tessaracoccus sp.]